MNRVVHTMKVQEITIRRLLHPFEHKLDIKKLAFSRQRLSVIIDEYAPAEYVFCLVNGKPVKGPARKKLRLKPGDIIDLVPAPGFIDPFTIALFFALVKSATIATLTSPSFWISVGLSYLGGRLLAPDAKESGSIGESQNFGWEPRTQRREGIPLPLAWGRTIHSGNIIARWTDIIGGVETLYMLVCFGKGPVEGPVSGQTYLNDQPSDNFDGVTLAYRNGTLDQSCIPGFEKTKLEARPGWLITNADGWVTYTTPNNFFDDIEFTMEFLLLFFHKSGPQGGTGCHFQIEISVKDADSWTLIFDEWVTGSQQAPIYRAYKVSDNAYGFTISRGTQYDVRFKKISPDSTADRLKRDMRLRAVREVVDVAFSYPGKVLLGAIVEGTAQLSGDIDVKVVWDNRVVNVYDGSTWQIQHSRNRAWNDLDALLQPVIRGDCGDNYVVERYDGFDPDRIDLAVFYEWAQWCDNLVTDGAGGTEARMTCDFIADYETDVFSLATDLARPGRMNLYWAGNILTGWVDKAAAAVTDLVTYDNIVARSWRNAWMASDELAGKLEVGYRSAVEGYERKVLPIPNEDAGSYKRAIRIEATGATSLSLATRIGNHNLYRNKLIRNRNVFVMHKDALRYRLGHVVRLSHRVPNWGRSYRIVCKLSANSVRLDRRVEAAAGNVLYLRYYDGASQSIAVGTYTIASISNTDVTVTAAWTVDPAEGGIIAIGTTKLRRIVKIEAKPNHLFEVEVETYDTDLFNVDAIEPDNENPTYAHTRTVRKLSRPVTREEAIELIKEYTAPALDTDTPELSNITWTGNEVDTVYWNPTTDGEPLQFRYKGTTYEITFGLTSNRFIYWSLATPNQFLSTDDEATMQAALLAGAWMVCENRGGVSYPAKPMQLLWASLIQAGTITANKLYVSTLAAISAALGSVTSGSITITLTGNKKLRISNQGIDVTNDGETWRDFLVYDGSKITLSFDCYDAGDILPGIGAAEVYGNLDVFSGELDHDTRVEEAVWTFIEPDVFKSSDFIIAHVDRKFKTVKVYAEDVWNNGSFIARYAVYKASDDSLIGYSGASGAQAIAGAQEDTVITFTFADELIVDIGASVTDEVYLKVQIQTTNGGCVDFGNGAGNVMTVDNVGVGATLIKV